jgi:hypothetical protein
MRRAFHWPWAIEGKKARINDARACVSPDLDNLEVLAAWPLLPEALITKTVVQRPSRPASSKSRVARVPAEDSA